MSVQIYTRLPSIIAHLCISERLCSLTADTQRFLDPNTNAVLQFLHWINLSLNFILQCIYTFTVCGHYIIGQPHTSIHSLVAICLPPFNSSMNCDHMLLCLWVTAISCFHAKLNQSECPKYMRAQRNYIRSYIRLNRHMAILIGHCPMTSRYHKPCIWYWTHLGTCYLDFIDTVTYTYVWSVQKMNYWTNQ